MENDERAVFRFATPLFWWTIYEQGQRWTVFRVLNVVLAILLSPLLILGAVLGSLFSRPATRSVEEVITFINNQANGQGSYRDWDDFCSVPIADPDLEAIRLAAARIGPGESANRELRDLVLRASGLRGRASD